MNAWEEIDVSPPLAAWLRKHRAVTEDELTEVPPPDKESALVFRMSDAAAARMRNGKMMHAVLVSLYGAVGAVCPMEPLVDMDDVCSRHLNWGRVMKVLKVAYAVDWTEDSDHKALVVGGSAAALVDLFDAVRSRTGEGYEALRAEALLHQASIDAAVAAGGCTGAGMRAKLWFQSFDGDRVMMWVVTLQQGMGVYACIMSSLLSVFVPQLCPDPAPLHVCTLHDNFYDLTRFNKAVLAINFITLFAYLAVQTFLAAREYWCIDRFDEEPTLRVDNLKEELKLYPKFKETLRRLNAMAAKLTTGLFILIVGNLVISSILILYYYSAGKTSVTGLISSTLLIVPRLLFWTTNSIASATSGLPRQLFARRPMLSNTVDKDWRFNPEFYVPNLHGTSAAPASGTPAAALRDAELVKRSPAADIEAAPAEA